MGKMGRPRHPDILTPREWEVLALLRERLTNEEIAQRLGISLDGAKYHVSQILSKLGVATREEAAALALDERRRWWARWPLWAKVAGAATVVAAVVGGVVVGVAALVTTAGGGHVEESSPLQPTTRLQRSSTATTAVMREASPASTPTNLPPSPIRTHSTAQSSTNPPITPSSPPTLQEQITEPDASTASPVDDRPRLHRMLLADEDLPVEFEMADQIHSVVAIEGGPSPPNARVKYELPAQPADLSQISCVISSVAELSSEADAISAFDSIRQRYRRQTGTEGQTVEEIIVPQVGNESAGSILTSEIWEIGRCGTRSVYAYAEIAFRRGSVIAIINGFTPRDRPDPQLVFDAAQTQLSRIDKVLSAP